jgi:YD repeat-containing protein
MFARKSHPLSSCPFPITLATIVPYAVLAVLSPSLLAQEEGAFRNDINPYVVHEGSSIDAVDMTSGALRINIPLLSYPQRGNDLKMDFEIRYGTPPWSIYYSGVNYQGAQGGSLDLCSGSATFQGGWIYNNWADPMTSPVGAYVTRTQMPNTGTDKGGVAEEYNTLGQEFQVSEFDFASTYAMPIPELENGEQLWEYFQDSNPQTSNDFYCSRAIAAIENNVQWVTTGDGAKHYYAATSYEEPSWFSLSHTVDGSGIAIPDTSYPGQSASSFIDRRGTWHTAHSYNSNSGFASYFQDTDRFGNTIIDTPTGWTDTIGRTIPHANAFAGGDFALGVPTADMSHCQAGTQSASIWNVPGSISMGGGETYYFCYSSVAYQTSFKAGQFDIQNSEYFDDISEASGTQTMLTQIVLPNETAYSFKYDPFLDISQMVLPTGASISYTYQTRGLYWTHDMGQAFYPTIVRAVSSRTETMNDGITAPRVWYYGWQNTPTGVLSGVLDPLGNAVIHNVSPIGNIDYGQTYYSGATLDSTGFSTGGTLLKTVTNVPKQVGSAIFDDVTGSWDPGNSAPGTVTVQYPNGSTSMTTDNYVPPSGNDTYYDLNWAIGGAIHSQRDAVPPQTCSCFMPDQLQSEYSYDFGTGGSAGGLLKSVQYQYMWQDPSKGAAYQSANLLDLPERATTFDPNGNPVASVGYAYDETSPVPSGLGPSQNLLPPPSNVIGQLTSECHYLVPSSSVACSSTPNAAYTVSTMRYWDTGELYSKTDPNGNTTTFAYGANSCEQSLPTTITNAKGQPTTLTYDCNLGRQLTSTDPNMQTTTTQYVDSMGRVTAKLLPDKGSVSINYNGDPVPPKVTVTTATGTSAGPIVETLLYDTFGRTIQQQVATSTPAQPIIYQDTSYDALGRVLAKSNPYYTMSDITYGSTSFTYDGLGRVLYQCQPDNGSNSPCQPGSSYLQWAYTGNTVNSYDELRNMWMRTYDGLGRLSQVLEPAGFYTTYSYDPLGNLLCVDQWGTANPGKTCMSGANRAFGYDSLSRLTKSVNLETGPVSYRYVVPATGALCAGDLSLPCSKTDARGVTVQYGYDALNRLVQKGSPVLPAASTPNYSYSCYQYDATSVSGASSSGSFVGRLTNSWTQIGSTPPSSFTCPSSPPSSILSRRSILAYDPLGRIQNEQQCTKTNCTTGTPFAPSYSYDLAGNVLTRSNGVASVPITLTNAYDSAGRLSTVTSSVTQYPTSLFAASQSSATPGYSPAGGLMNATFGTGLTLFRTYDSRLRITGEIDTGNTVQPPTPGAATISITGSDQHQ